MYSAALLRDLRMQPDGPGFSNTANDRRDRQAETRMSLDGQPRQVLRVALRTPNRVLGLISVDNLICCPDGSSVTALSRAPKAWAWDSILRAASPKLTVARLPCILCWARVLPCGSPYPSIQASTARLALHVRVSPRPAPYDVACLLPLTPMKGVRQR